MEVRRYAGLLWPVDCPAAYVSGEHDQAVVDRCETPERLAAEPHVELSIQLEQPTHIRSICPHSRTQKSLRCLRVQVGTVTDGRSLAVAHQSLRVAIRQRGTRCRRTAPSTTDRPAVPAWLRESPPRDGACSSHL